MEHSFLNNESTVPFAFLKINNRFWEEKAVPKACNGSNTGRVTAVLDNFRVIDRMVLMASRFLEARHKNWKDISRTEGLTSRYFGASRTWAS